MKKSSMFSENVYYISHICDGQEEEQGDGKMDKSLEI